MLYQVRRNTYDKSEIRQQATGKEEGMKEKVYHN
jgi:hypothetical protein